MCSTFFLKTSSQDNALFASKDKINVVWNFFERSGPSGPSLHSKKFQTTLILVFEVIVQPPKTHFLTFSSETKIMKITHSAGRRNPHIYEFWLFPKASQIKLFRRFIQPAIFLKKIYQNSNKHYEITTYWILILH